MTLARLLLLQSAALLAIALATASVACGSWRGGAELILGGLCCTHVVGMAIVALGAVTTGIWRSAPSPPAHLLLASPVIGAAGLGMVVAFVSTRPDAILGCALRSPVGDARVLSFQRRIRNAPGASAGWTVATFELPPGRSADLGATLRSSGFDEVQGDFDELVDRIVTQVPEAPRTHDWTFRGDAFFHAVGVAPTDVPNVYVAFCYSDS